jgi:hypothetical protein
MTSRPPKGPPWEIAEGLAVSKQRAQQLAREHGFPLGRLISISMDEYRLVRNDHRQFAVVPEHFIGDIERIVLENDRFAVVAKRDGTPGRCGQRHRSPELAGNRGAAPQLALAIGGKPRAAKAHCRGSERTGFCSRASTP